MSAPLVRKAWKRIERWCQTNDPQLLRELNPGASKKEIRDLETAIQQPLPEDVRTSLSMHNGQPPNARPHFSLGNLRLYSCEDIARDYSGWRDSMWRNYPADDRMFRFYPETAIQHHHFNDGWVPIVTEDGCGNFLAVDLAPGPTGTVGQVIDFGRDVRGPGVLAPNWGAFLSSYADLLDIVIEINRVPDDYYEAFHRMCPTNFLDGMVGWTRDGRWPIVRFPPSWRTSTVMSLATMISETDDISAMPILADALEDAGCDAVAVLDHCRDRECKHTQGCWVIDTLVSGNVTKERWCHGG